jgi:hypothetical protein
MPRCYAIGAPVFDSRVEELIPRTTSVIPPWRIG